MSKLYAGLLVIASMLALSALGMLGLVHTYNRELVTPQHRPISHA